jgi:tetratricopeptide (TPR) repeat protein
MTSTKPIKYNPAFLTQEELIKSFVVRTTDLELIMELIRENRGQTNQHLLIVGLRGSGKTTLALRIAAELRKNKDSLNLWYPIVFSEESYEVCSPGEFWLEALFHISKQTKEYRWKRIYKELRSEIDESRLRDRALAQLMDFADEQGKRLLFIVENLSMLLGQQIAPDAAWEIRHTLMNEPRLMLLGTATSRFEQIENSDKAMFELFKIHELEPLSSDDCRTLWRSITGQELKGDRIRPIQILTGGSPRLLVIISVFAAKASFRELMEDLTHLVDEHTEYFKSHIDNLPPLERKVFVTLADLWQPSTAREVAEAARIDVNKASAYLKRLISKGAVMEVEQDSGRKWYQLAERMYNIYHLMRRRGEPSNRVRAVVDFMVHFYAEEDLVKTISSIAEEACAIDPESRSDHFQALVEILKAPQTEKYRQQTVNKIPKKLIDSPDLKEALREMTGLFPAPSAEPVSFTQEELQFVRPNNPDDPNAWIELGEIMEKEAERLEDAEHAYREAIRIDPKNIRALGNFAFLLKQASRFEEAEEVFKAILDIDPGHALAWNNLGDLYAEHLDRYEEAEKAYRKAVEIDPDDALHWGALGFFLLFYSNRHDEAEKAFRKAIELESDFIAPWGGLGFLLDYLERYEEAEASFKRVLDINPTDSFIMAHLGDVYRKTKRYEEAEHAYHEALQIDQSFTECWLNLIVLQMDDIRSPEKALQTAQKAIEASDRSPEMLNVMAQAFYRNAWNDYLDTAETWSREAVEKESEDPAYQLTLASIIGAMRRWEEALEISPAFLNTNEFISENMNAVTSFFINAATAGYEVQSLKILEQSPIKKVMEPLITGLKIFLGEKVRAPQEVMEIGKDVAKRIKEMMKFHSERG